MATKTSALSVRSKSKSSLIKSPREPSSLKASRGKSAAAAASERRGRVAETAYYLAEKRGFAPGGELDDWFRAESIIASGEGH